MLHIVLLLVLSAAGAAAQVDSFRHVHTMKAYGPASVQVIWLDPDTSEAFVERSIALQAALQCGTASYKNEAFQQLCKDYRLEWEAESHGGIHRLGLTFSHLQKERALALLEEVLRQTAYGKKDWEAWRKKELYHYSYYEYDSDSSLKWWMTGKDDFYKSIGEKSAIDQETTLMDLMGKPTIISTIGNTSASYFENQLRSFLTTEAEEYNPLNFEKTEQRALGNSTYSYTGLQVTGSNPLEVYAHYVHLQLEYNDVLRLSSFQWSRTTGALYFKKGVEIPQEEIDVNHKISSTYAKEAELAFALWLEFNKNEALAKAYQALGIWPEAIENVQEKENVSILHYRLLSKQ